ncbi:hypothetical protein FB451DRAFT_1167164 [Mycena latifolia]|nr:hypothetical protein FB451DRAFT_1167164 [Mycena latifolia]
MTPGRAFLERNTKHQSPDSRSQTPDTVPARVKLEDDVEIGNSLGFGGSDSEEGGSARIGTESATELGGESSDESGMVTELQDSNTAWLNHGLSSCVRISPFRVTSNVTLQRVEYLTELASVYPTLRTPTALVVDLHDPKFNIKIDTLIKTKDTDSWTGNTGTGNSKVFVTFLGLSASSRELTQQRHPCEGRAPEMIKLCRTHGKHAVLDFKGLVPEDNYNCLLDFTSIDSEEKLEKFSQFVVSLGQKKIHGKYLIIFPHAALKYCPDWWDHKAMSAWILPCLIKSQSPMSAEDWDSTPSTMNIDGDPGVLSRSDGKSGILVNSQNKASHRRARNTMCQSTMVRKSRESRKLADERARIDLEIEAQKQAQKEATARLKELKELKSSTHKTSKSAGRSVSAMSSSSGHVASRTVGLQLSITFTLSEPFRWTWHAGHLRDAAALRFNLHYPVLIQGTTSKSTPLLTPEFIPASEYAWSAMQSQKPALYALGGLPDS